MDILYLRTINKTKIYLKKVNYMLTNYLKNIKKSTQQPIHNYLINKKKVIKLLNKLNQVKSYHYEKTIYYKFEQFFHTVSFLNRHLNHWLSLQSILVNHYHFNDHFDYNKNLNDINYNTILLLYDVSDKKLILRDIIQIWDDPSFTKDTQSKILLSLNPNQPLPQNWDLDQLIETAILNNTNENNQTLNVEPLIKQTRENFSKNQSLNLDEILNYEKQSS